MSRLRDFKKETEPYNSRFAGALKNHCYKTGQESTEKRGAVVIRPEKEFPCKAEKTCTESLFVVKHNRQKNIP